MTAKSRLFSFSRLVNLVLIVLAFLFFYYVIRGFIPIPLGFRHVYHLLTLPNDLFQPIQERKFNFYEAGYTERFELTPKYFDSYCIGYKAIAGTIPSSILFDGEVRADFFYKDTIVQTKESKVVYCVRDTQFRDSGQYTGCCFMEFDLPLDNKHLQDVSVRLTVIKPSKNLVPYQDNIELEVSVSGKK